MRSQNRSATIKADTPLELLVLIKPDFDRFLKERALHLFDKKVTDLHQFKVCYGCFRRFIC